jgi:hypothetical protein
MKVLVALVVTKWSDVFHHFKEESIRVKNIS